MQKAIENLEKFPRLNLGFYPTPLEELKNLREKIRANCPRIFIKRDDWTGFGFGGNKIRKQEYLFAKLLADGVKTVITTGGERSNHARMTAAVCAKLGLNCVLVLDRKPRRVGTENLQTAANFVEELYGAEIHIVDSIAERNSKAKEIFENLNSSGEQVYQIPLGGAAAISTLGFVLAMRELSGQMQLNNIKFDHLFLSSSTGGTHAGMLIGAKLFGFDGLKIIGISPEPDSKADIVSEVERLVQETGELLEIENDDLTAKIEIIDSYAGKDYCIETEEAEKTLRFLAETEAVLLDSVYTAKAFAGLIDWIEKRKLKAKNKVLFWHTGGQLTQFYVSL
jgi:D-cysteine desulfhydrase family pyridoxal phosphate-dependent enzyme